MKRKRKKEEKKRKEEKRKRYCPDSNSGPSVHRAKALPLKHVGRTHTQNYGIFIITTFEPH